MHKNEPNLSRNFKASFSRYTVILLAIIGISFIIRFYFYPPNIPLVTDGLLYFAYSSAIHQIGGLPSDWSPLNNGWPIFLSIFFTIFDSKDILTLMQIQKLLAVVISILIVIPVYFLCKKFVARKFALVGASFIAFDPRLMINSFLGTAEPLYLLLITSSLTLFLFSNKKLVYFSFVLVSFATMIRGEGLVFFLVLSIMFLIRYRKENYKILFLKYFILLVVVVLIILPISIYRVEVIGQDGIFMRSLEGGNSIVSNLTTDEDSRNNIIGGVELFIKYLIWVLIPNFIIFIPLGLFLIFKNRNFEKNTIILSLGILALPALYAYTVPALDTKYLYVLFPMFSVLSVLSIEKIVGKLAKQNIIIVIIISVIIISSVLFYDYKKTDYEHQKESIEIMNEIFIMVNGTNTLYPEGYNLFTSGVLNKWSDPHTEKSGVIIISTDNFSSLKDYIIDSKDKGLTHIMVDDKKERPSFLVDVFANESNYPYLEKTYDSNNEFIYHVKVFKINYEKFNLGHSN